jgi:hypothetical protein
MAEREDDGIGQDQSEAGVNEWDTDIWGICRSWITIGACIMACSEKKDRSRKLKQTALAGAVESHKYLGNLRSRTLIGSGLCVLSKKAYGEKDVDRPCTALRQGD